VLQEGPEKIARNLEEMLSHAAEAAQVKLRRNRRKVRGVPSGRQSPCRGLKAYGGLQMQSLLYTHVHSTFTLPKQGWLGYIWGREPTTPGGRGHLWGDPDLLQLQNEVIHQGLDLVSSS
jgi:hypothetical protein